MENNKWLILNYQNDCYTTIATHWREALINYLNWIGIAGTEQKKEMFKKAFMGFTNYSEAIELFNSMYYNDDESIQYMSPILKDCYCKLKFTGN